MSKSNLVKLGMFVFFYCCPLICWILIILYIVEGGVLWLRKTKEVS
jgi:hypothetical protein